MYEGKISTLIGKEQWELHHDGVQVSVLNTMRPRGKEEINIFLGE